jgi:Asp-tRNA(Asn)/Glu-tRNA(Gln) amidotransferase A subunit family amidase
MSDVDVLVAPSTPFCAPRHEDQTVVVAGHELPVHLGGPSHFTRPISSLGVPAVALPVGFTSDGLPFGAQLIGRRGSERDLLAAAIAYQGSTEWHRRLPTVHA